MVSSQVRVNQIYLRHLSLQEAKQKLTQALTRAYQNGELINVIIHGQGHESEGTPVIKQFVRGFLESSDFARRYVYAVYPGETGSPYTSVNPGETVVVVKAVRGDTGARLAGLQHDLRRLSRQQGHPHRQSRPGSGDLGEYGDHDEESPEEWDDPLLWKSKYDDYEEALEERESRREKRSLKAGRSRPKNHRDW
ncbi:MAG: Smr/MutS family protein [Bacteroidota bacterium]